MASRIIYRSEHNRIEGNKYVISELVGRKQNQKKKKKGITIIGRNCHNDVTGIRKCTAFVYTPANRRSLLSLAGSTWQVDSVSRSLDPLPRLHRGVEGLDCRLSFLPTGNSTPTQRGAEERIRIRGGKSEGFFFSCSRGQSSVCRGGSIAGFFACNDECDLVT